ncbi:MAG: ribosomal RNA small subunit methyltransferase A [Clostridiales bacterium]|nr:ribosomal RNA small subunit methyltransferase A [Clostridiales bacterium]
MTKERVLQIMKENNILPEAGFGQNFLCDEDIIEGIIEAADIRPGDTVLEIGPGIGALTEPLSKMDINLRCVEIDKRLVSYLRGAYPDVEIIDSDFLKLKDYGAEKIDVVISNLPYYIMTDIMMKVFEEAVNARTIVYMVEEAALDRILCESSTKSYGPLAVVSELYGAIRIVSKVPGTCFVPQPRTTSAVISFKCNENRPDKELMAFIKKCFAQRRKTLANNLKGCDKEKLSNWVKENFTTESIRAEVLEPCDFRDLYNTLK